MAQHAAALQREFPTSIYAKLIADPLYREHQLALHNAVASRVDSAFTYYKNQYFKKAAGVLARTEKLYPKSDLADRVAYLKMLLVIRTQPPLTARSSVEKFCQDYPQSPLVPHAQELAATYKKQGAGQIAGALAATEKPVVSLFRPGEVDNRMRVYYRGNETPAKALNTAPVAPETPKAAPNGPLAQAKRVESLAPTDATASAAITSATKASPRSAQELPTTTSAPVTGAPVSPTATTPAPAASPPATSPGTASAPSTGTPPAPTSPAPAVPAVPAAPATAYTAQLSGAHAVVLVFANAAPAAPDLATQLGTYNNRFFRANNLQIESSPLGADQTLVVVRTLPGAKVAQSYATKLRGPQSPLARLRGAGYQALVISTENLNLLKTTGDLAGYLSFYQRVYK
jgi:hypothetical protein